MPKRTLHLDIQADDTFISRIETEIKRRWGAMNPSERAVTSVLINALNEDRQASTTELANVVKDSTSLESVVQNLRTKHLLPVMAAVGRSGGYRLPVSRADCELFLQAEVCVLFKKIGRLITTSKTMTAFNVQNSASRSSIDAMETLYKIHNLDSTEEEKSVAKTRKGR